MLTCGRQARNQHLKKAAHQLHPPKQRPIDRKLDELHSRHACLDSRLTRRSELKKSAWHKRLLQEKLRRELQKRSDWQPPKRPQLKKLKRSAWQKRPLQEKLLQEKLRAREAAEKAAEEERLAAERAASAQKAEEEAAAREAAAREAAERAAEEERLAAARAAAAQKAEEEAAAREAAAREAVERAAEEERLAAARAAAAQKAEEERLAQEAAAREAAAKAAEEERLAAARAAAEKAEAERLAEEAAAREAAEKAEEERLAALKAQGRSFCQSLLSRNLSACSGFVCCALAGVSPRTGKAPPPPPPKAGAEPQASTEAFFTSSVGRGCTRKASRSGSKSSTKDPLTKTRALHSRSAGGHMLLKTTKFRRREVSGDRLHHPPRASRRRGASRRESSTSKVNVFRVHEAGSSNPLGGHRPRSDRVGLGAALTPHHPLRTPAVFLRLAFLDPMEASPAGWQRADHSLAMLWQSQQQTPTGSAAPSSSS